MNKKFLFLIIVFTVLIASTELVLRFYFGFCDTVLMQDDPDFEYIAQPNQSRFRFRNHIYYNSFSMRSQPVDTSANLILGFGDSVINGGVQTDQDSLATTILSDSLSKREKSKVQFLNISAGSWGPDNCFAYLEKYGDFGAKQIYLFVSSHDAYDSMTFERVVDHHESYPSRQYPLAIMELAHRYIWPRLKKVFVKPDDTQTDHLGINKQEPGGAFNSGFSSFQEYARRKNIKLVIYLHADEEETQLNRYNDQGQAIIKFAFDNGITIIKDLENGIKRTDFRDIIHINAQGQKKVAAAVLSSFAGR